VIVQLNKIVNTPSLTLMVNPENLTVTYAKKQQYQDRNRFNYIFQSWGEEQVRLSVSGRSSGFVVGSHGIGALDISLDPVGGGRANISKTSGVSGYQWASKLDSVAWQNFMTLMQFYRNNGYIYDRSGVSGNGASEAHLFVGTIEISYDQWLYIGNFENFSYQYSEMKQHGGIEFSFDFVASSIIDRGAARSGVSPVTSYQNPPTPSPSMAPNNGRPVLQDSAVRTARELPSVGDPAAAGALAAAQEEAEAAAAAGGPTPLPSVLDGEGNELPSVGAGDPATVILDPFAEGPPQPGTDRGKPLKGFPRTADPFLPSV
jgi:hypothetical protein